MVECCLYRGGEGKVGRENRRDGETSVVQRD